MENKSFTILISGYYGMGNWGDESVLLALTKALRARYPQAQITVFSGRPAQTEAQLKPWQIQAQSRTRGVLAALAQADLLISGGGSLLQDVTSSRSCLYYLGIIGLALLLGKPVYVFAQGIGPLRRPWVRLLTRWVLLRVTNISVRDPNSARALKRLGIKKPIALVADPVFTLSPPPHRPRAARLRIGVCLRSWPGEHWQAHLGHILSRCQQELAAELLFIPFHPPGDLVFAQGFAARLPQASTICSPADPEEIMRLLASCHLVIGMRLHALIMAALVQTPSLGISYDPKVTSFLESIDQEPFLYTDSCPDESLLWERLTASIGQKKVPTLRTQKAQAQRGLELLANWIQKGLCK